MIACIDDTSAFDNLAYGREIRADVRQLFFQESLVHVPAGAMPLRFFATSDFIATAYRRSGTATARTCECVICPLKQHQDIDHESPRIRRPRDFDDVI